MADRALRGVPIHTPHAGSDARLERKCSTCGEGAGPCPACDSEETAIARKAAPGANASDASPMVGEVIGRSGAALDPRTQAFMETRFGHDFSRVRVHADSKAARSASSVGALAYTVGTNIVFARNQYTPASEHGRRLLAHELAHVVQQSRSRAPALQRRVVDDAAHVTCRATRANAAATLRTAERTATTWARSGASALRAFARGQSAGGFGEATVHATLWRTFHLNRNDAFARCTLIPEVASRLQRVGDAIATRDYTYRCAASGSEPSGACTDQPGVGGAWTTTGSDSTALCDWFWGQSADGQAEALLHEWVHNLFSSTGDCPSAVDFEDTHCYANFARQLTTGGGNVSACCPRHNDAAPALTAVTAQTSCPSTLLIGPDLQFGYAYLGGSGIPGSSGIYTSLGLQFGVPLTRMREWELLIAPRFSLIAGLARPERYAFLLGVRLGLEGHIRPYNWSGGISIGGFLEGGGAMLPTTRTALETPMPGGLGTYGAGGYGEGGLRIGYDFSRLGRREVSLFAEIAGGLGSASNDPLVLSWFRAGLGLSARF